MIPCSQYDPTTMSPILYCVHVMPGPQCGAWSDAQVTLKSMSTWSGMQMVRAFMHSANPSGTSSHLCFLGQGFSIQLNRVQSMPAGIMPPWHRSTHVKPFLSHISLCCLQEPLDVCRLSMYSSTWSGVMHDAMVQLLKLGYVARLQVGASCGQLSSAQVTFM